MRDGLGRAVRPRSLPAVWSSAGTESRARATRPVRAPGANVETSSHEGSGPRTGPCRGTAARLTAGNPSGTEVSSGPADTCRPWGRGVEDATGTTPSERPGDPGCPPFIPFVTRTVTTPKVGTVRVEARRSRSRLRVERSAGTTTSTTGRSYRIRTRSPVSSRPPTVVPVCACTSLR